jgi:lipopolysaccharide transport system ATP-binding protein
MSLHTASEQALQQPDFNLSQPVVRLQNVSVRYRVPQERIPTFKEYAIRWLRGQVSYQTFWALNDISLDVMPGEVFGIIGLNGAGKSTLLKVIARVLYPTRGRVQIRGRIAPLLELGAGFDTELTGRENIYLNGTILGFTRRQIDQLFPQIVEFSGLEEFIDAPLRTYSNGMYARLGFSVATAARPDILIVDEILGVGDAEFQTRSYERILGFRAEGTTILLVSHSLERVKEVCNRAMWLDHGRLVSLGTAEAVVNQYLEHNRGRESERLVAEQGKVAQKRWGNRQVEITRVRISGRQAEQTIFRTGDPFCVQFDYIAHTPSDGAIFGIAIHRQDGVHVTGPNTAQAGLKFARLEGSGAVTYQVTNLPLLEGLYHLSVAVVNQDDTETYDYHDRAYPFRVENSGQAEPEAGIEQYGLLTLGGKWQIHPS